MGWMGMISEGALGLREDVVQRGGEGGNDLMASFVGFDVVYTGCTDPAKKGR